MIVYVESNFVLEMALEQEQFLAANAILALAESNKIKLVFPSFVLSEPFESVMRERREHNTLQASLEKVFGQLQRSEPYKQVMLDVEPLTTILREAHVRTLALLHSTFEKLLTVGECIEVNVAHFREALKYQQSLDLFPQDSIIYSAIIADLKTRSAIEAKCFLSRDKKAFEMGNDRRMKTELELYNCRYIGSFTDGLNFIQRFA